MKKKIYAIIIFIVIIIASFLFFYRPSVKERYPPTLQSKDNINALGSYLTSDERLIGLPIELNMENKDEFWWVDFILSPDSYGMEFAGEDGIKRELYALYDPDKNKYPSSYIANPRLRGVDLNGIDSKMWSKIILLIEREDFNNDNKRYVFFLDEKVEYLPEEEIKKYKDW